MNGGSTEADRVRALREVLTATGAGIYLATHVAGPIPAETMAAVHESDDLELRVGRVGPDRAEDMEQREKEARAVAAASLKASPERIVLAHGVNEVARSIVAMLLGAHEASDASDASGASAARVLLAGRVESSLARAVAQSAAWFGAAIEHISDAPSVVDDGVALVVLPHVDINGVWHDLAPVADAAHASGARLLVDASLSLGALPVDVATLGADVVVADTSRWLLGPDAVALAWLSPSLGEDLPRRLRDAAAPFGRGALLALARSLGWLLMYVELPWVVSRTQHLAERLYADLGDIAGVETVAHGRHGAIAAFRIAGWDAEQAAEELSRGVFAIVDADVEADLVRASVGAWNREDELRRFSERVAELAAHTPATLPRKPSLTVISGPVDGRPDDPPPVEPDGDRPPSEPGR